MAAAESIANPTPLASPAVDVPPYREAAQRPAPGPDSRHLVRLAGHAYHAGPGGKIVSGLIALDADISDTMDVSICIHRSDAILARPRPEVAARRPRRQRRRRRWQRLLLLLLVRPLLHLLRLRLQLLLLRLLRPLRWLLL